MEIDSSYTDLEKRLDLNELSEQTGILIPGQSPIVKATSNGFAITAGLGKIKVVGPLILILIILLVPIILILILPGDPEKFRKTLPSILPLLASLVIFFRPLKEVILKKGVFEWVLSTNTARITYKSSFKTNVVELPVEDLFLKIYMHTGNHKKLYVRHGWYVLSLCSKVSDEELFISCVKSKRKAIGLSEKLNLYLPVQTVIEDEKIEADLDGDGWDVLAAKTFRKPLFKPLEAASTNKIRVHEKNEQIIIEDSRSKWISFAIILGCGIMLAAFTIIMVIIEVETFDFESIVLALVLGSIFLTLFLFLVVTAFKFIAGVNSVVLNKRSPEITIKYGWWFKKLQLDLSSDKLSCRLFVCDKDYSNKVIEPGMTVLVLSNNLKDREIIVAVTDRRDKVEKAFNVLSDFLGDVQDETLQELELASGEFLEFPTSCLTDGEVFGARSLKIVNENTALLKRCDFHLIPFTIGILLGSWLLTAFWTVFEESQSTGLLIFIIPVGLFMFLGALVLIVKYLRTRVLGFCLSEDMVYSGIFANRRFYFKKEANISDILALQLCSAPTMAGSDNSSKEGTVYQLTAIMRGGSNAREFICSSVKPEQIFDTAERLRDFLDLPLIDNTI